MTGITKMTNSITVQTGIGPITLMANEQGLTQIILPGAAQSSQTKGEKIKGEHSVLQTAAQQIKEYTEGKRFTFDLPLSPDGTEFQKRVWRIIKNIPYGQTLSYGEIARKLGDHNKARAVGGAANANPLSLVVPCHRVVGSDGSLTGYAGGLDLKQKLLQFEKSFNKE